MDIETAGGAEDHEGAVFYTVTVKEEETDKPDESETVTDIV